MIIVFVNKMGVVFKKKQSTFSFNKDVLNKKKVNHCYWMCVLKQGSGVPSLVQMYSIIPIGYFLVEAKVFSIR